MTSTTTPEHFPNSKTRHGSLSGWTKHQKLAERPCDPCYRAKAAYDKGRNEVPERALMARLKARAQGRAYGELARRYPEEYRALYAEHVERLMAERDVADAAA